MELAVSYGQKALRIQRIERTAWGRWLWVLNRYTLLADVVSVPMLIGSCGPLTWAIAEDGLDTKELQCGFGQLEKMRT